MSVGEGVGRREKERKGGEKKQGSSGLHEPFPQHIHELYNYKMRLLSCRPAVP